jgi:hypothetical protein
MNHITKLFQILAGAALLWAGSADAKSLWTPRPGPPPFNVQVHVLRTFGDGCPQGTVRAAMTPDQSSVSILFDNFVTEIQATPALLQARKVCNITLGIKFPGQYRVAIVGSDVRGFVHVPQGAASTIAVNHHSIYGRSDRMNFKRTFNGPTEQTVEMNSRFMDAPLWSQCGTQFRGAMIFPFMTISMEINSASQNPQDNLLAAIDAMDFSAPLSYHLAWTPDNKNCPR